MRHRGPGYHNLCVLSCLAPVVNINIKTKNQHKIAGDKKKYLHHSACTLNHCLRLVCRNGHP